MKLIEYIEWEDDEIASIWCLEEYKKIPAVKPKSFFTMTRGVPGCPEIPPGSMDLTPY
ncbi:MAG TPA: hypothetical protein VJ455_00430 [Ignavibacteria bacterium]|nr:hypothetical protein [Ignavibacteria bacterium]